MSARLIAGAIAIAVGMSGASRASREHETVGSAARPVVVRVSAPVPAGIGAGHVSFVATFGGTRWSLLGFCTGGEGARHPRVSLVAVSEPGRGDE